MSQDCRYPIGFSPGLRTLFEGLPSYQLCKPSLRLVGWLVWFHWITSLQRDVECTELWSPYGNGFCDSCITGGVLRRTFGDSTSLCAYRP